MIQKVQRNVRQDWGDNALCQQTGFKGESWASCDEFVAFMKKPLDVSIQAPNYKNQHSQLDLIKFLTGS